MFTALVYYSLYQELKTTRNCSTTPFHPTYTHVYLPSRCGVLLCELLQQLVARQLIEMKLPGYKQLFKLINTTTVVTILICYKSIYHRSTYCGKFPHQMVNSQLVRQFSQLCGGTFSLGPLIKTLSQLELNNLVSFQAQDEYTLSFLASSRVCVTRMEQRLHSRTIN